MKCHACNPQKYYKNWEIKKFPLWTVYIHPNQCYLGRCFVVLNRHLEDFFDITEEELSEYFFVVGKLRNVLRKLFQPNLFNYAILQNSLNHVHLNVVPRYKEDRIIGDIQFIDLRWGHNYSPYNKEYSIPDELLYKIREKIKSRLSD